MKCTQIGEQLMDVVAGAPVEPQLEQHLRDCPACAEQLSALRQTMTLLDEWQAPEPSPYFGMRLQARLREEAAHPQGWFGWLRRPALALALLVLLTIGSLLVLPGHLATPSEQLAQTTAVKDLQALDKDPELFATFDLLDDVSPNEAASANP